jgi:hypothetical protein
MRSLKKIDLPILSWLVGEPDKDENASGFTAAATPTLDASAGAIAAAMPPASASKAATALAPRRLKPDHDDGVRIPSETLFPCPKKSYSSAIYSMVCVRPASIKRSLQKKSLEIQD